MPTVIFDIDGTLYEDERLYDRYVEEITRSMDAATRSGFWKQWEEAKRGEAVIKVGMGYDRAGDRLFRWREGRITSFIGWDGAEEPVRAVRHGDLAKEAPAPDLPIEVPIFGEDHANIGDFWGLADVLATHAGVARDERSAAFFATRASMMEDGYDMPSQPGLHEILSELRDTGSLLIAVSNSPEPSVSRVVQLLGVERYFHQVVASAHKPAGLKDLLAEHAANGPLLCVGDNFVNDIEPALERGCRAVYIDRHGTGLGSWSHLCHHVMSLADIRGIQLPENRLGR